MQNEAQKAQVRRALFTLIGCVALALIASTAMAQAPQDQTRPSAPGTRSATEDAPIGRDPGSPRSRFDLRVKYRQSSPDDFGVVMTPRLDSPIGLGGGWLLALRFDLPLVLTDRASGDNPDGGEEFGFGDALSQFFVLTPPQGASGRFRVGAGAQLLWPTASHDEMGSGKYQLAPSVVGVALLPELSRGSFAVLLLRDFFSYAGADDRRDIHEVSVQPGLSVNLPRRWFVSSFPDIRINWEDEGKAFVPVNLEVGLLFGRRGIVSATVDVPIVDDYHLYEWQTEFRIGFFF